MRAPIVRTLKPCTEAGALPKPYPEVIGGLDSGAFGSGGVWGFGIWVIKAQLRGLYMGIVPLVLPSAILYTKPVDPETSTLGRVATVTIAILRVLLLLPKSLLRKISLGLP